MNYPATPPALFSSYQTGSGASASFLDEMSQSVMEHFTRPATTAPRLCANELLGDALATSLELPSHVLRAEAARVLGAAIDHLAQYDLSGLPPFVTSLLDDGSMMVEWPLDGRRLGLNFGPTPEESGWFFVSSKEFGDVRAHGHWGADEFKFLLPWVLSRAA
ncbi:MAG: hypothetical protein IPJ65_36195 [Archangiaceae bacterium]|nr:hypothetical protein [Archangiaceae bacterium]